MKNGTNILCKEFVMNLRVVEDLQPRCKIICNISDRQQLELRI